MIFNNHAAGASELKELLGFIYKSNNFANMISFIGFAENDMRKIISNNVFNIAEAHYNSSHYNREDPSHPEYTILDSLVYSIQLPVALHAYRRYALQNDLAHSDKGRYIIVTSEEKPAFEWMIDKSDKSLLDLAHEATDILLEFLDKYKDYPINIMGTDPGAVGVGDAEDISNTGDTDPLPSNLVIPWAETSQYKVMRELFITKDQFNTEFFINGSRRVFLAVSPFIRSVQKNEIFACIGSIKYGQITRFLFDGSTSEEMEALLVKIRPALALFAMSKAVLRLSVEILPDGIFSNFITGTINSKSAAADPVRVQVSNLLNNQAMLELAKLQDYISRLSIVAAGGTVTAVDPTERIDPTLKYVRL
jgi:hypothetical protein